MRKLRPSSAAQWINCPGAPKACEGIPYSTNAYATEGTGAHALGEHCLRKGLSEVPEAMIRQRFTFENNFAPAELVIDEQLAANVDKYLRAVWFRAAEMQRVFGFRPKITIEKRLDLFAIGLTKGKIDVTLDAGDQVVISDFKYGYKPVYLSDRVLAAPTVEALTIAEVMTLDEQLMCYAVGISEEYQYLYGSLLVQIVQPRAKQVRTTQEALLLPEQVATWKAEVLAPAVRRANETNPPLKAGAWCEYCPARKKCPAFKAQLNAVLGIDLDAVPDPQSTLQKLADADHQAAANMTPAEIAHVLLWVPLIKSYVKAIEEYAHEQATVYNVVYPGFKVVRGNGRRYFPDGVQEKMIAAGFTKPETEAPAELLSPNQFEKRHGKRGRTFVKSVVLYHEGALDLSPEQDQRTDVKAVTEFAEYAITDSD